MIDSSEGHPVDDIAAYAVDALDEDERRTVEDHLAVCERCLRELQAHYDTLASLTTDEAVEPPRHLWLRVAAQLSNGDRTGSSTDQVPGVRRSRHLEPVRPQPERRSTEASPRSDTTTRRAWRRRGVRRAMATAAVVAAIVGGIAIGRLSATGSGTGLAQVAQAAFDDADKPREALLDPTGHPVADVVRDASAAFIRFGKLGPAPGGGTYQLWQLDGPQPVSLAVLGSDVSDRTVVVAMPDRTTRLAITAEPTGGTATPTGPVVGRGILPQAA